MKLADLPGVQALSLDQKVSLVEELWGSISNDLANTDVTEEEKQILDERWAQYLANPSSALTLDQLKAKMAASRQ